MRSSGLLGRKLGMTQIFDESGACVPVTVLQVGPCTVIQKKRRDSDGYSAVQIGYEPVKEAKANKPYQGHFKKNGLKPFRHLKEFRISEEGDYTVGQLLDIHLFQVGDAVDVIGTTKGRGFQGVQKRHGFRGGPGAHGSHFHRIPGSIGQCTSPAEVHKGRKLPGRMGGDRVTVRNVRVVAVRPEENILLARGAVPGPNEGLIFVRLDAATFTERVKAIAPEEASTEVPAESEVVATGEEESPEKTEDNKQTK